MRPFKSMSSFGSIGPLMRAALWRLFKSPEGRGGVESVAGRGTVDRDGTLAALGTLPVARCWRGLGVWKPGSGVLLGGPGCWVNPESV